VTSNAPGGTLGQWAEGDGPLPRGYECIPAISANHASHKPFPLTTAARCPLTHKPGCQLSQFLAPVHPLHPGCLLASDPREWVQPFWAQVEGQRHKGGGTQPWLLLGQAEGFQLEARPLLAGFMC
jgi:hypothetical protein